MSAKANRADLILNARLIRTMDSRRPVAKSLAVVDGRVAALGTPRQMHAWRSRRTRVVDATQAVAIPAFTDCHTHLYNWACQQHVLDLSRASSLPRVLKLIEARANQTPRSDWLLARGFNLSLLDDPSYPAPRRLLDAVTAGRQCMVNSRDYHSAWLNSAGLKAAGIIATTKTPAGGRILRDHRGRPTGILQENALQLLPSHSDTLTDEQVATGLQRVIRQVHRCGITTIHSLESGRAFEWFNRLRQAGELNLRVCWAIPAGMLDEAIAIGLRSGLGDDLLWIGGLKIFADGALGSQTAYMYRPYPERPGYYGQPTCVGKELRDLAVRAAKAGLPSWIHAIGDRANHEAVVAIAAARRVEPVRLNHRIEHAQCIRPADLRRYAQLDIIASMQPCHIPGDIALAERYWPRAARWAYPCGSLARAGVTLAFGSDVPVEAMDPLPGLRAAVHRQDHENHPAGGWHPAQRVTITQALEAYTVGAAIAGGKAGRMGRLSVGMPADIAVLSQDPFAQAKSTAQASQSGLPYLRVMQTVFHGRVVYQAR
jgi:predicted amidohydrolase YtcJ